MPRPGLARAHAESERIHSPMPQAEGKEEGMDSSAGQWGPVDRPTAALGMIGVQPGAVVSRTLIKKPSGTVTLFAFDSGEELSEHTAPYSALLFALRGEAEVRISGKPHELHTGELLGLPANEPHALRARSPFQMMLIMIRD